VYVENDELFEKISGGVYRYDDNSYALYLQRVSRRLIKKMGLEDEDDVDIGVEHGDHYELFIEKILVKQLNTHRYSVLVLCPKDIINHVGLKHQDDVNVIMRKADG
jgi:antitoxin component of MazEF toxin-antitoxin module